MKQGQTPDYWDDAVLHLSKADKVMKRLITRYKGGVLKAKGDGFHTLARAIVGQQISVKAADSIWARLESELGVVTAEAAHVAQEVSLRSVGLSASKVSYLKEVAGFFKRHNNNPKWAGDDQELISQLTDIKGVGVWTAEMFMIFHLLKPDVLPLGDIGLLKSIAKHYADGENISKEQAEEIAEPWKPYRSVATWYLWRSLDPVVVEY